MRTPFLKSALILALFANGAHAMPAEKLVDLVMEKKIVGQILPGNRPIIESLSVQEAPFELPQTAYRRKSRYFQKARFSDPQSMITKTYEIKKDPEGFYSRILVTDGSGQEIRQISVGRRATRLLANPSNNRLYVLCGGYFGSVWEIDTARDIVVKKLPEFTPNEKNNPLWNPSDIALFPEGNTMVLASGALQLIDIDSGKIRKTVDLPVTSKQVLALYPLSKHSLGIISQDAQHKRQFFVYKFMDDTLKQVGYLAPPFIHPTRVSFKAPAPSLPSENTKLAFVASKNSDFIHVLNTQSMQSVGMIPVDFPVDSLLLSQDRKRLFAYHQRFGQVSVIELDALASENYFSVIKRIRDLRFKSNDQTPFVLGEHFNEVYLWDGYSKIVASIHKTSLETKVGLPFRVRLKAPQEKVYLAQPAGKRFYLRDHELYMENIESSSTNYPEKMSVLGEQVKMIQLSPNKKHLYALDQGRSELVIMNIENQKILKRIVVGKNPSHLYVSNQTPKVYVFSSDEGSIMEVNTRHLVARKINTLEIGKEQPQVLTLYEKNLTQFIHVELPRYLKRVAMMVG